MTLLTALPRIEEHRVPVVFDCPKCRAERVRGMAYTLRETIRFGERVPPWGWSSHWVRCSECSAELQADCDSEDFKRASPATVNKNVHAYFGLHNRFLALAGLAFSWAPLVGLLVSIAAMAMNLKTRGWPRIVSVVALGLTAIYNAALFGSLAYWTMTVAKPLASNVQ